MFFEHIYDKTLAQGSYLIGCQATGEAIVIDAKRDVDTYLEIAQRNNLRITHITETHIHADFLCGSRELAALTGAEMYLSEEGGEGWLYEFPHTALHDGSLIKVGNLTLQVLHTSGHTPESISFLLTDHPASDKPVMIFTGDFVFIGDVGRPDLLEKAAGIMGTKEQGAKQMFQSLKKFMALPDYVQVWSAHGAGSACGKALGAVHSSTVGYEKIRNWALQFGDNEAAFIEALLEGQPEPPKYFAMMKRLNKVDRPLVLEVPKHPKLSQAAFLEAYENGVKIIDTRHKSDYAAQHVVGTYNIQGNNSFANWMGWILNYDEPFVLIANEADMDDLSRKLMRIGLDNCQGFISEIPQELPLSAVKSISLANLKEKLNKKQVQIVDVRGLTEYQAGHIAGADHVFLGTLENNLAKVSRNKEVIIHCQAGDRSSIAYSILERQGYTNVLNYAEGMKEWQANEPVVVG